MAWQAAGDTYAHSYYGHAEPAPATPKPGESESESAAAGMLCYPVLAEPATACSAGRGAARLVDAHALILFVFQSLLFPF
jgi:hypothetical protein